VRTGPFIDRAEFLRPRRFGAIASRLAILAAAWALLFAASAPAQQPRASEYQVKAAYLFNFGKFVKWPDSATPAAGSSFAICLLGQDPFGSVLDSTLAGEALDGKPVTVKRISKPQEAADCRILFINSMEQPHLHEILAALGASSVLTVSDMPDFSRRGGMIQFVLDGERIRFEVNLTSAEAAKLTLSSELLKVATTVRRESPSGD
jgi:hypothetical protein